MSEHGNAESGREEAENSSPAAEAPRTIVHLLLTALLSVVSFLIFLTVRDGVEDNKRHLTATDHALLAFFHAHQHTPLTEIARVLAFLGSPWAMGSVAVLGTLIGLTDRRVRAAAWTLPLAILGAGLLIQGVKVTFHRQRPSDFVPLLKETGYSFPSGHSLIAVVVYGLLGSFLMRHFRKRAARIAVGVATVLLVLSIGVSRVYVGVHYPTDVLAGWSLGVPWLIGCRLLAERWARREERKEAASVA